VQPHWNEWERAMILVGDILLAVFELVADFYLTFWPWHGDKKKEEA
jgi:hypothetical protein